MGVALRERRDAVLRSGDGRWRRSFFLAIYEAMLQCGSMLGVWWVPEPDRLVWPTAGNRQADVTLTRAERLAWAQLSYELRTGPSGNDK